MRTAADIIAEIAYDAYWDNLIDADETIRQSEWVVWSANSCTAAKTGDPSKSLRLQKITVDTLETI